MTPITMLAQCRCGGFVPRRVSTCPHCGLSMAKADGTSTDSGTTALGSSLRRLGLLGGAIGGGVIAFTLMACYGRPPCPEGNPDCHGRATPPMPVADDAGTKAPDLPLAKPGDGAK